MLTKDSPAITAAISCCPVYFFVDVIRTKAYKAQRKNKRNSPTEPSEAVRVASLLL